MHRFWEKTALLLTIAVTVSLCSCGDKETSGENTETGVNVSAAIVSLSDIESRASYTGEIKAGDLAGVSSKVSARVLSIHVEEGTKVQAGDVLATLDTGDLQLAYNQALAAYNSAKANYDMTANATTVQSETAARQALTAAQTEYNNAKAAYEREQALYDNDILLISARNALNDAKQNCERMEQLFQLGSVSQVDLNAAQTAVQNAQANVVSMESNKQASLENAAMRLQTAENQLHSAEENWNLTVNITNEKSTGVAKANMDSAKAALDIAASNLANAQITAPISGYVASKNLTKGQFVSPGAEIFSIKNINLVEADFHVTESVIPFIHIGTEAKVSVSSAGLSDIQATVTAVNQAKDAATGLYHVKIAMENEGNLMKIGMFADIGLTLQKKEKVPTIPTEAIFQDGDSMYVYVIDGKTASKQEIMVGISDGEDTEILSGLNVGQEIVLDGKDFLSETNNIVNVIR